MPSGRTFSSCNLILIQNYHASNLDELINIICKANGQDEENVRQQREIDIEELKRRCAQEDEAQIVKRQCDDLEAQKLQLEIEERKIY